MAFLTQFVVKNIGTKDKMETTAGSSGLLRCSLKCCSDFLLTPRYAALIGTVVSADALVIAKLREAGAILLGHANLSEWAAMRASY